MRILQLPVAVANQIAAGEVIERPASVVKELLENSKDAKATKIEIEIGFGGLNQIKISDDGHGIVAEDLKLAIAAHATSKIRSLDDLYALSSMGFRGEALASIASIARMSIHSKPKIQDCGMILEVDANEVKISPLARANGTTIDVKDIFYSAPVRKSFLKSAQLEFQAIEIVVKRFSLSSPELAISLSHNAKKILSLPPAFEKNTFEARVLKLFGKSFIENSKFFESEHLGIKIYGWLSLESYQRSQSDRLWIYINGRMVKDKLICHAIRQAYESILNPGRHPVCLVYLVLDPKIVDVNVHPTKHEVRFQDPRMIHDFIYTSIRKTLEKSTSIQIFEAKTLEFKEQPIYSYQKIELENLKPETEFISLGFPYILFFLQNESYLIDIAALFIKKLEQDLAKQKFPLQARPLFVPVSIEYILQKPLNRFQKELALIGLDLIFEKDKLRLKTIPVAAENLDIKAFFKAYFTLSLEAELDREELLKLLVNNQTITESMFKSETYTAYLNYLIELPSLDGIAKKLTKDLCRELINAV